MDMLLIWRYHTHRCIKYTIVYNFTIVYNTYICIRYVVGIIQIGPFYTTYINKKGKYILRINSTFVGLDMNFFGLTWAFK